MHDREQQDRHGLEAGTRGLDKAVSQVGATVSLVVSIAAFAVSAAGLMAGRCDHTKDARRAEGAELTSIRDSIVSNALESPSWQSLHRFASDHRASLDELLRLAPVQTKDRMSEGAERLVAEIGEKLAAVIGNDPASRALCTAKLDAFGKLGRFIQAGIVGSSAAAAVMQPAFDRFVTDDLFRCGLLVEPNRKNRAMYFAGFYRGDTAGTSIYARDPGAALWAHSLDGIRALAIAMGTAVPDHFSPPGAVSPAKLKEITLKGCAGYIKNLQVAADSLGVAGTLEFSFMPLWNGAPGQPLPCVEWRSGDRSSGFELGFKADGATYLTLDVPRAGRYAATVPRRPGLLTSGKHTRIGFAWDFRELDPSRVLELTVGDEHTRAIPALSEPFRSGTTLAP